MFKPLLKYSLGWKFRFGICEKFFTAPPRLLMSKKEKQFYIKNVIWIKTRSNQSGPAQGLVGPKATTLSKVYSYTLNSNRIFI